MYDVFVQLCQRDNVTPYVVSKATKIPASTFTDWKNGRSTPKMEKLQKIADFFNVSVEYLITGSATGDVPTLEIWQSQEEDPVFMYHRAEAIHGMLANATKQKERNLIELIYVIMGSAFSDERIDLLTGYVAKLSEDQKLFVDSVIERELLRDAR